MASYPKRQYPHNESHNLYSLPNASKVFNKRSMKWEVHEACEGTAKFKSNYDWKTTMQNITLGDI